MTQLPRSYADRRSVARKVAAGRGLGSRQYACLVCLLHHGGWPGGWVWDNPSTTAAILDSLVRRGLAVKEPCDQYGLYRPGPDIAAEYSKSLGE